MTTKATPHLHSSLTAVITVWVVSQSRAAHAPRKHRHPRAEHAPEHAFTPELRDELTGGMISKFLRLSSVQMTRS